MQMNLEDKKTLYSNNKSRLYGEIYYFKIVPIVDRVH